MTTNEVNEFKIEKIERQSIGLGIQEAIKYFQYALAGFEIGLAIVSLNPLFLLFSLGYFTTAQMDKAIEDNIREDIKKVESIENEEDLKEYKVERIEACEKELNTQSQVQIIYGVTTAIAIGGMMLAPVAALIPLYVGIYGLIKATERKSLANYELENLSNENQEETNKSDEKVKVKNRTSANTGNIAYAH